MPRDEYETVQFDRLIQDVRAGYGREATPAPRPYPVLRFLVGLGLVLVDVILGTLLVWLLQHLWHG